ncbi:acyl-CoA dehydrogenase family protein [Jatrophihabitans endophyticus]|uniref:acyl-CoA dehydrogenase family protein n=1 Tax=Jatrophihabitans endophyticus TaxID=1206085 RepID=UPI001A01BC31|nr:acyl-CoA dehydrogenase family protein [Jatrophihabitans endophyticus]MBE7190257.1 acyl-CoA dehydrogenase family protein [Jatrophihabitans endophyticus]
MELDLTDEQKMLTDAVNSLLEKRYDANTRLDLLEKDDLGWSRDMWKQYAELGLLGLTFDEQYGGAGMGVGELSVVMEAFGRALVLEPFVATVVLGGALVAAAGTPEQKQEILPGVAGGDTLLAFAHTEAGSRWSITDITTTATQSGDSYTLSGEKVAVLGGDVADRLIVSALVDGSVALFVVDGSDVVRSPYKMQDGLGGADVLLADTPARLLGTSTDALEHIGSVLDVATAALCAEAVGAMERMLWLTVDYLKTRVQFGQPISVFQALQFRAADMYVAYEQAKSMAIMARLALADDDVVERRRAVGAAKVQIDLSSRKVGQDAIQLHGGIGMTMEYPVGHYVKRTAVIAKTFADTDTLLETVGADGGLIKP